MRKILRFVVCWVFFFYTCLFIRLCVYVFFFLTSQQNLDLFTRQLSNLGLFLL